MSERIVITVFMLSIIVIGLSLLNRWQKQKASRSVQGLKLEAGKLTLMYFYSPDCSVCKNSQKTILENVKHKLSDEKLTVISINASEEMDTARQWGVTTLPTICVFNESGEAVRINNGLVTEKELQRQLNKELFS